MPVIATNSGGSTNLVVNGENGWLVEESDAKALTERIIWSIQHKSWPKQASANAKNMVRTKFKLETMIDSYSRFFGNLG